MIALLGNGIPWMPGRVMTPPYNGASVINLSHIGIIPLFHSQSGRTAVAGVNDVIGIQLGQTGQRCLDLGPGAADVRSAAGTFKEGIAGEHHVLTDQANGTGGVAGGMEDGNCKACQVQDIALAVSMGIVELTVGEHGRSPSQM